MRTFSISMRISTDRIFSGYFTAETTVTTSPQLYITAFYDYSLPTGPNTYQNVLLPKDDALSYDGADNIFCPTEFNPNPAIFTSNFIFLDGYGVNFTSSFIQHYLSIPNVLGSNYFNLYCYPIQNLTPTRFFLYNEQFYNEQNNDIEIDCTFAEIFPTRTTPFLQTRSAYTNNSLVFYKSNSLPSCGVGTTRNARATSRRV